METSGITLMRRELSQAARTGHADRVKLLLARGARTDEMFRGKTAWRHAIEQGHVHISRLLEEAGAPTSELNEMEISSRCILSRMVEQSLPYF